MKTEIITFMGYINDDDFEDRMNLWLENVIVINIQQSVSGELIIITFLYQQKEEI